MEAPAAEAATGAALGERVARAEAEEERDDERAEPPPAAAHRVAKPVSITSQLPSSRADTKHRVTMVRM